MDRYGALFFNIQFRLYSHPMLLSPGWVGETGSTHGNHATQKAPLPLWGQSASRQSPGWNSSLSQARKGGLTTRSAWGGGAPLLGQSDIVWVPRVHRQHSYFNRTLRIKDILLWIRMLFWCRGCVGREGESTVKKEIVNILFFNRNIYCSHVSCSIFFFFLLYEDKKKLCFTWHVESMDRFHVIIKHLRITCPVSCCCLHI